MLFLNMNDYQVFRNACEDIYCQLFTGRFTIHENGFFDVLTDIPTCNQLSDRRQSALGSSI